MAFFQNIFNKKKEPNMSVDPNASNWGDKYKAQNYSSNNIFDSLKPPQQPKAPTGATGGGYVGYQSGATKAATGGAQATTGVSGGATGSWGSNTPKPPQPLQTQAQGQAQQQSPMDRYQAMLDKRTASINANRDENAALQQRQFDLNKQTLQGQIPGLDKQMSEFRNMTNEEIEALRGKTDRARGQVTEDFGDVQRQAAQTRRETMGQTGGQYGQLNTIDSFGEGSYGQATENIESDFNRFTQQNLKERANSLANLEEGYADAERQASASIRQKAFEMDTLKQQIQTALAQNDISQAQSLSQLYQQAQNQVFEIQDAFSQVQMSFEQEAQAQQQMMDQLNNLSPDFKATGQPSTQNDLMFMMQNPDIAENYSKVFENQMAATNTAQKELEGKQNITRLVDEIAGGDTNPLTGDLRLGGVPGANRGSVQATKAKIEQLKSLLTMAARGQLKGQGTITDAEQAMLEKSLASLDYAQSDDEFRRELQRVKAVFGDPNFLTGGTNTDQANASLISQFGG